MHLTPGEKLTLIQRSAEALAEKPTADIDLTLRVFGFPYGHDDWNQFNGGPDYDYVIDQIAEGSDKSIIDLHSHLSPDASQMPVGHAPGGPWQDRSFRLFLSHTHQHREVAGAIKKSLSRWAVDTFVAHDTIEPSKEWQDEIEAALGTCDAAGALLTPEFRESSWCDQEIGFCLARGVLILPIQYGVLPYGFVGKFQALNAKRSSSRPIAFEIFRTLATHAMTREKMMWPLAQRYVHSPSFEASREAFKLLETIPADRWTSEMLHAVEEEALGNNQIAEAYLESGSSQTVPQAMKQHLDDLLGRMPF